MGTVRYAAAGTMCSLMCGLVLSGGCTRRAEPDAYGNVEASEVIVSAEAGGRLVTYAVADGQKLSAGAVVGTIDIAELGFERDRLIALRAATASRINEVQRQIEGLEAQRAAVSAGRDAAKAQRAALVAQYEIAKRAYDRTGRLFAQQAATAQQLDQTERDYRVLGEQIKAQDSQIDAQERQVGAQSGLIQTARAQQQTVVEQITSADAQVSQIGERIRKGQITNPLSGTVLTSYAKAGEVVQMGQPLYKIANLDAVEVRAYVTERQLAGVRLGQDARISVDNGPAERLTLPGTVEWISPQAEFTPTPIQTREERADLVYAVKLRVQNESGRLKIGMPVDVRFVSPSAAP